MEIFLKDAFVTVQFERQSDKFNFKVFSVFVGQKQLS